MQRLSLVLLGLLMSLLWVSVASAQESGSICVLAYEDANQNNARDEDEVLLPGIAVNLAVDDGVIVRSHITKEDIGCFEGLEPRAYSITFVPSANHRAITEFQGTITVTAGTRQTVQFSAVAESPFRDLANDAESGGGSLDTLNRVLLAAVGAFLVMLFMLGLGFVIASLMS